MSENIDKDQLLCLWALSFKNIHRSYSIAGTVLYYTEMKIIWPQSYILYENSENKTINVSLEVDLYSVQF